jgi:hypothetical protein
MKASSDPLYALQFEYVEKLRTFLDQDISFKEVIAIDRKVRTRWGTRGVASYNEDMVDLVATMHNFTKVRTELDLSKGFKAGGGGGGGGDGRNGGRDFGDQKPERVTKPGRGMCWGFNTTGCLNAKNCKFLHQCDSCGSKKHGSSTCGFNR